MQFGINNQQITDMELSDVDRIMETRTDGL